MKHITVYVVLLQRTLLLDTAGPLEVLRVANREQQEIRFEVHYVGPEASIVSSIGITLAEIEPLPKTLPDAAMVVLSGDVDYMMMPGIQVAQAGWGPGCSRCEVAADGGPAGA
jgi:transcriptional regulator GlxA family with amidase domain